jgi:hypothetical protein
MPLRPSLLKLALVAFAPVIVSRPFSSASSTLRIEAMGPRRLQVELTSTPPGLSLDSARTAETAQAGRGDARGGRRRRFSPDARRDRAGNGISPPPIRQPVNAPQACRSDLGTRRDACPPARWSLSACGPGPSAAEVMWEYAA